MLIDIQELSRRSKHSVELLQNLAAIHALPVECRRMPGTLASPGFDLEDVAEWEADDYRLHLDEDALPQGSLDFEAREEIKKIARSAFSEAGGKDGEWDFELFREVSLAYWHRVKPGRVTLDEYRRHFARSRLDRGYKLSREVLREWPPATSKKRHIAPGCSDWYPRGIPSDMIFGR